MWFSGSLVLWTTAELHWVSANTNEDDGGSISPASLQWARVTKETPGQSNARPEIFKLCLMLSWR